MPEGEYAITFVEGKAWQLDGENLHQAANVARQREDARALSDTMSQVLTFIRQHPEGTKAADLAEKFGKNVYQYLTHLTQAGQIDKVSRGLYVPTALVRSVGSVRSAGHRLARGLRKGQRRERTVGNSGRLSLDCRARQHHDCRISWCGCDCHHVSDSDRLAGLDDGCRFEVGDADEPVIGLCVHKGAVNESVSLVFVPTLWARDCRQQASANKICP